MCQSVKILENICVSRCTAGGNLTIGVVDTGGKFTAGIVGYIFPEIYKDRRDTGGNFSTIFNVFGSFAFKLILQKLSV
jgi:hypothetical protein